jgi:hypothetical protein
MTIMGTTKATMGTTKSHGCVCMCVYVCVCVCVYAYHHVHHGYHQESRSLALLFIGRDS